MHTQIVEVTNGPLNWGKFLIGQFTDEWQQLSIVDPERRLLPSIGIGRDHFWLLDLQTGEGAMFRKGGLAKADLNEHKVWVCPMFEPFLEWLYAQPSLDNLPAHVDLPGAPFAMQGYRRAGK